MQTVFTHIIQKRLSQDYENVATDALTYVLESSETARMAMTKFLQGVIPNLPFLRYRTQQAQGAARPDMCAFDSAELRVFVENKFWAGLTDNQPVHYLRKLGECSSPTILLVVAPEKREHTLWRELTRRLEDEDVAFSEQQGTAGVHRVAKTQLGPILALTSWADLLSALERAAIGDPMTVGNLLQLRSLCEASDNAAFTPIAREELSDQRTPAFRLQLSSIVREVVDLAVSENVLDLKLTSSDGKSTRLMPTHSWDRIGRYAKLSGVLAAGVWLGIRFDLWAAHGTTPLWMIFSEGEFGRAAVVRPSIEAWSTETRNFALVAGDEVAIALDIPVGKERPAVIRAIVHQLKEISMVLDGGAKARESAKVSMPIKARRSVPRSTQ